MTTKKKLILAISSFLLVAPLSSCDLSESFGQVADGLLPNLWLTLTQVIVVLATAAVVIFLAYKPLKMKLKQRQDYIENNIKDSEDKKAQAEKKLLDADDAVTEAQKKAGDIIQEAQKTAELKAQSEQKALALSIENQKEQAHKDIEAERARMISEAHNQIVSTAIDASKQILGREVNEDDNKKMVDDFINQLSEGDNK